MNQRGPLFIKEENLENNLLEVFQRTGKTETHAQSKY